MKDTQRAKFQLDWLWYGIFFLFFFQLLTDFVAAVYAIGLLGVDIPPELITVLVLFAPIVLVFVRRAPGQRGLFALMLLVLITSLLELLLDTRGRMLVAGMGAGACLVLLPALLFASGQTDKGTAAQGAGKQVVTFGTSIQLSGWAVGDAELAHVQPYKLWIDKVNAQGGLVVRRLAARGGHGIARER